MAAWLVLALLWFSYGGGGGNTSSPPGSVANPTLQALIEEAEQTPVEDYVGAYARQLCDPIRTYFEAFEETLEDLANQPPLREPTPEDDLAAFGSELEFALALVEKPMGEFIQDIKDVDPPEELEDYHASRIAKEEHTLEMIRGANSEQEIDIYEFANAPEVVDEPSGLRAAFITECGPGLEDAFEQFGVELFDSDAFGGSGDGDLGLDETPAPPETGAIGDTVANGNYELTVHSVTDPYMPSDEFFPDARYRWVMFEVSITNSSDEPQDFGSYDFRVKDADNFEYTTGFVDPERELSAGSLQAGDTVRGQIGFEVPSEAVLALMIYDPGFFGESRIDIELQ